MSDYYQELSRDLLALRSDDDAHDVRLCVINNVGDSKPATFRAHSLILRARSPYFRRILSGRPTSTASSSSARLWNSVPSVVTATLSGGHDERIIELSDFTPDVFEVLLKYIYGGTVSFENLTAGDTLNLLTGADRLELYDLFDGLQARLIDKEPDLLRSQFILCARICERRDQYARLKDFVRETLDETPEIVFSADDFTTADTETLLSVLARVDLRLNETEVWNKMIEWARAKDSPVPEDPSQWSPANITAMSERLAPLLQHLRIYHIPSDDFFTSVKPYSKILPEKLYDDVLRYHLVRNKELQVESALSRRIPFDSLVVKRRQLLQIASWIMNKSPLEMTAMPCAFELLVRGSRDGFTPSAFHSGCDGKGSTVTVMRVKDTDEIIGGYNPLAWHSQGSYQMSSDSFVFSLRSSDESEPVRCYPKDVQYSLYSHKDLGPCFGRGYDLVMQGDFQTQRRCYSKISSYHPPSLRKTDDYFSVDEYEVFLVHKVKSGDPPDAPPPPPDPAIETSQQNSAPEQRPVDDPSSAQQTEPVKSHDEDKKPDETAGQDAASTDPIIPFEVNTPTQWTDAIEHPDWE